MVANPAKFRLKCLRKLSCKHKCLMAGKYTAQKNDAFITDFFSKCDQMYGQLRIWSHLMKKAVKENFIFSVLVPFTEIVKISTRNSSGQISFYAIEKLAWSDPQKTGAQYQKVHLIGKTFIFVLCYQNRTCSFHF